MSNIDQSNNNNNNTTENETQLDDLVSQLRKTINNSDWLKQNTSAKWEQENPELSKQWREAMKNNQSNDTTQQ